MKLGVFGGTFDPPHIGHLIVAQDAALALGLDRVVFVPAGSPPHKRHRTVSTAAARLAMIEAAVNGNGRFAVDPIELQSPGGPSYTIDTLRKLAHRHPGAELWLLIGADQWAEFETWREPEAILRTTRIAVISRQGAEDPQADSGIEEAGFPASPAAHATVRQVRATRIDVSSSEIRRRIGVGESVRYLVPDPVLEIIFREQLYR